MYTTSPYCGPCRIEYYWADGCEGPEEAKPYPHGCEFADANDAKDAIFRAVRENWGGDRDAFFRAAFADDDSQACFHEYPEDHERGYGCGGYCVVRI